MRARVVVTFVVVLGWAMSTAPRVAHAGEPPIVADADARERSRVAFRKGVAQLRAQDWSAARASFETAWGLYPHPSILLNLGIARLRTDDPVRAEQDLVRFLSEDVGAAPDELSSAREALAEARTKVGTLRVIVSPASARVSVDGKAVETVRRADPGASGVVAEMRAKPGRHSVIVEAEGHTPGHREIDVTAKGEATAMITLTTIDAPKPREITPSPVRAIVGWSLAGLAGASLITGAFTALRANTLSNEYSDPSSSRFQDHEIRSEGITFRTAADVALGVAVLSGAVAVVLLVTDFGKGSADVARAGARFTGKLATVAELSLPTAKDLRERANRVGERAALPGTPRTRFLREVRRRLVARLLPTLAMLAVGTGVAAITDSLSEHPGSRWVSLSQGLTATALAGLALATSVARKNLVALNAIALAGAAALSAGWGAVASLTGGVTSPYALAVPLGISVMALTLPLPPRVAPVMAAMGGLAMFVSCPGAPPSAFVAFLLLGAGAYTISRTRRKRSLLSFRRVERLAGAVARIRRVQEQLVMVEKLEALRVLVGGMAHEINNALAISLASTDQVIKVAERDPAGVVKAAHRAQGGLVRIRATIDRLRRFAMAEESVLEPADVTAMLDFALESAIGRARSGVIVDRDYEEGIGQVECHVGALAEALFQVAKNAIESMPKGGHVRASARRDGDKVVLAVADEGAGIPPARLAKVFDPFYARDTVDTLTGGRLLPPLPGKSGLGLSAVYGLVASMGGKVEIRSEVGKGTEVSIVLPVRRR